MTSIKLSVHNGVITVACTYQNYPTPVHRVYHYPTELNLHSWLHFERLTVEDLGDGRFLLRDPTLPTWSRVIRLPQGSATQAVYVEETQIPCPKVRKGVEVRWYGGRWEKYSKREGWVLA